MLYKYLKNIILIVVICVFGYAAIYYFQKSNRMEGNFYAGQGNNPNTLYFTKTELKEYLKETNDSLLKVISDTLKMTIRPRNITQISNFSYHYLDTNINVIPIQEVNGTYPFVFKNECRILEGLFNIDSLKLYITRDEIMDSLINVEGGKRAKIMKWLFGGIRLGKREPFDIILSRCGSGITKKEINVIK